MVGIISTTFCLWKTSSIYKASRQYNESLCIRRSVSTSIIILLFFFKMSFYFYLFILFGHAVWHGDPEFPNQGLNPGPCTGSVWSLNHWTTREIPSFYYSINIASQCPPLALLLLLLNRFEGGKFDTLKCTNLSCKNLKNGYTCVSHTPMMYVSKISVSFTSQCAGSPQHFSERFHCRLVLF